MTLVYFHQRLNSEPVIILELLERLLKIDPDRAGYYKDKRSEVVIKQRVNLLNIEDHLDLSNLDLTVLNDTGILAFYRSLDLSFNSLSKADMSSLVSVVNLNLDHNELSNIKGVEHLSYLRTLSLKFNCIHGYLTLDFSNPNQLEGLRKCRMLESVSLEGNELTAFNIKTK